MYVTMITNVEKQLYKNVIFSEKSDNIAYNIFLKNVFFSLRMTIFQDKIALKR